MSAFGNGLALGFTQGLMFNNMFCGFGNPFFGGFFNPFFGGFMPFNCWHFPMIPMFGCGYSSFPTYNDTPNHCYDNLLFNFSPVQNQSDYNWDNMSWNYENYNFDTFKSSNSANQTITNYTTSSTTVGNTVSTKESEDEVLTQKTGTDQNSEQSRSKATNSIKSNTVKSHWTQMTDEEMKEVYGDYTRDITVPYSGNAETLNEYLKNEGVLADKGQTFMDAQEKYGISASVLAAICINESGHGKSRLATNTKYNNVCGLRESGSTKFRQFKNVDDCIMAVAELLQTKYAKNSRPLTKLYQVNAKYCPVQDTTDTKGRNNLWAKNVEHFASEIEQAV